MLSFAPNGVKYLLSVYCQHIGKFAFLIRAETHIDFTFVFFNVKRQIYGSKIVLYRVIKIIYVGELFLNIFTLQAVLRAFSVWYSRITEQEDSHCGLVVRVPVYKSRGSGSILGTTRFSE
jgi:hypothetical protein